MRAALKMERGIVLFIIPFLMLPFLQGILGADSLTLQLPPVNLGSFKGHTWCTVKFCTADSIKEEIRERKLSSNENVKNVDFFNKNVSINYNQEKLLEQSFMSLFYSPPKQLQEQTLVIITTSYRKPPRYALNWINSQPWPVFISTKEKNFGISSEPWGNVGQEISSYMRFILMFWEYLPEHMAFVHGHERTWHQEGYTMSYMLRNICLKKYEYASLNAYESDAWRPIKGSINYFIVIKKNWKLVESYLGALPKRGFKEKCCAQFVVSRDRIKARPRALYELILNQMIDSKKNYARAPHGKNNGWDLIHFWEAIWHYIMGENAIVNTRKKYGYGIDISKETGKPLSKRPERTLKNVITCHQSMKHNVLHN